MATTSGDAWWSARIPEGREDLLAVLARVRGRHVDVPVLDRMTEYEAFWIAHHEDSPSVTSLVAGHRRRAPRAGPRQRRPGGGAPRQHQGAREAALAAGQHVPADLLRQPRPRARGRDRRGAARPRAGRPSPACAGRSRPSPPVRGRKSLLLLSEGFLEDFGSDARAVAAASREANTAVYFVDVRGLVAAARVRDRRGRGPAAGRARAHGGGLRGGHRRVRRGRRARRRHRRLHGPQHERPLGGRLARRRRVARLLPPRVLPAGGQGRRGSGGTCASR